MTDSSRTYGAATARRLWELLPSLGEPGLMVFREGTGVHLAPDLEATLWFSPVWRWAPQWELKQVDPREAPLLPIPFNGRELAAFLLHPAISASFPDPHSVAHRLKELLTSGEDSVCRCAVEDAEALLARAFDAVGPMTTTRWCDLDRSDDDSTPAEQVQADRHRSEDEEIDWLNRMVGQIFSGGIDGSPRQKISVVDQRCLLILRKLEELGFDPLNLPTHENGKEGVKSAVKKALGKRDLWAAPTVFERAWEALRRERKVCEAKREPSSPKR